MPKTSKTSKKRGTKSRGKTSHKKKTTTKKARAKKTTRAAPRKRSEIQIDRALTDNFITLQKIMVNFSTRFDILSNQISKLLELFEISAKSLARRDLETDRKDKDTKKIIEKLDTLSQQAGLIGKGLALIHEISSEKAPPTMPPPQQRPLIPPRKPMGMQGYQRSIASRDSGSGPPGSTKEIPK
jgi:hypothetical protein